MLRLFAFVCVALTLSMTPALAQPSADEQAVTRAVFDYFHGQGEANLERMQRAFIGDKAVMFAVNPVEGGGETIVVSPNMNEILQRWAANPNPPGGARDGAILDMHITDGRIANVMFRSTDRFYDALTLVKINGEWRIVSKVFVRQ